MAQEIKPAMTPPESILTFLAQQPDTIRENLYDQIGFYFLGPDGITPDLNFRTLVIDYLSVPNTSVLMLKVITARAALDYSFSRPRNSESATLLAEKADEMGSENLKRLALQIPLRDRHFQKAAEQWAQIRLSGLADEALHRWETTLWASLAIDVSGK